MLNFLPLVKAIQSLSAALADAAGRRGDLLARDGCPQRFEYIDELCVNSLRRHLEDLSDSPPAVDALGFKDMVSLAGERSLVVDVAAWFAFRELRNTTAHAYGPVKAELVFAALPEFLRHAEQLGAVLLDSQSRRPASDGLSV